ncbi:MAG: BatD family protein [Candidatus Pedobacter colombiensis]|uniref:BatD family protein n=1 Tax=Candidatus Pedobacter colombiensis TaxID=3121371 RepID=A0AAJ5WBZ1_9SPHI|nr:BatD family protein [Pedobacter sp.]WEK20669.1 MAG: BatD family protein [Pedobacter sp.]
MRYYLLSVLLLWSAIGLGQTKVTASVSSNQVATGEQFEITFSTNGNPESFDPPAFNGFQVVGGPNQSSSFSSVNGATTASISVGYILIGVKEGEYTIGPATMLINGKAYKSNGVKIKVTKGRAVPQQSGQSAQSGQGDRVASGNSADISKQLFLRAIANKTNVYQGEQIAVTYKLYANIGIVGNEPEKLPDFNGFWSQEIKNGNQNVEWKEEVYNGVRYHVAVLKEIILFPERFGKLTLDPLIMNFVVRKTVPSNDPIEQFFGGGSYEDVKYKVKSAPVTINVKALPDAGKPEGFEGAVGTFAIGAAVDKSSLKANEAVNYTLKITGSGNLKLLKAPTVNFPADLEKYDPKITDQLTESMSGVSGSREFSYLLIPRHEGNYTIEPLKFSYFNPATQKYVTLTAGPFNLKVAKGAPGSNVTAYASGNQQDIKMLAKDIAYIKTGTSGLHKKGSSFYGSAVYYALLCLGPLLFIAAFVYRKEYRELNRDQVKVKGRNANKVAAKHLSNAKKQLLAGDKKLFYQDVYKGLYQYLSDKFNIPAAELNKENISEQLTAAGIASPLINQLTETLDLCEMARYAPVSGISDQEVFDKAKGIINDIEGNA